MSICSYDSGSMTGNRPLCKETATQELTYRNGSYGPFVMFLCDKHVKPMLGATADPSATVRKLDHG